MYGKLKDDDRQTLEIDFGNNPDILRRKYLDMYEAVQSEVLHTISFDESSDLCMTYLDRAGMTRVSKIKAGEKISISEQGYTIGKL